MINCKQASQLASRNIDQELGRMQRISLKFHLLLCRYCRNYNHHLHFIRRATQKLDQHIETQHHSLSSQSRANLKQSISDHHSH